MESWVPLMTPCRSTVVLSASHQRALHLVRSLTTDLAMNTFSVTSLLELVL